RLRLFLPYAESWVEVVSVRHENVELGPFPPGRAPAELTVELVPYPEVSVVVSADGARVLGAQVAVHQLFPESWTEETNGFPVLLDDALGAGIANEDGVAVASLNMEDVDSDAPLEFVIRVAADGWPAVRSRVFTLRELRREEPIEVELEVGGVIEGELLLPDGESPAGRYVAASCGDGKILTTNLGRDGRYRFAALTPGSWLVRETFPALLRGSIGSGRATKPGETTHWSCEVRAGETTRFDLDLRDEPRFKLRGSVRTNGGAVGAWSCRLTPPGSTDAILDQHYKTERLDPNGQFEFSAPRLGSHRLTIRGSFPLSGASGDGSEVPTSDISIRDTLDLAQGEQEWSAELTLAELRVRFDPDVEGTLTYTQADGSRVIRCKLVRLVSGEFVARVPAPAGELSWRADGTTEVLQRVEVDPTIITEIDLTQ
ncbi:MAG: carboxypeptidase-like regulatory domain-containing protein, partial [Planctomycetota bacterium]